jgi:hypothetical protein
MTDSDLIKSMRVFFIDNQGAWPTAEGGGSKAELVGNFVVWPDPGKYPSYVPIAMAEHPHHDGKIVVMAGNRGIVLAFITGAKNADEVRVEMSKKGAPNVEQYRIAVDSLIHAVMLHRNPQKQVTDDVDPLSLLTWMASSEKGRATSAVIANAVSDLMSNPGKLKELTATLQAHDPTADAFMTCDGILSTIQQAWAVRSAQSQAPAPVPRRE